MTDYVAATLQNLLRRSLALPISPAAPQPMPAARLRDERDNREMQPMLFRSEGFAEDLFDSYPSH